MAQYKLEIEIVFQSQTDAEDLMNACESLVVQEGADRHKSFSDILARELEKSILEAKSLIGDSVKNRDQITLILDNANKSSQLARELRQKANDLLENIKSQSSQIIEESTNNVQSLTNNIQEIEKLIEATLSKLIKFDEEVKRARQCVEATDFVQDMIGVHHNIVSGGSVKLIWRDPSQKGEKWLPVRNWQFDGCIPSK